MNNPNNDSLEEIAKGILSAMEAPPYPSLGADSASATTRAGVPGASPFGQIVDKALRDILGVKLQSRTGKPGTDIKQLVTALNQVFTPKEIDGHTEWEWKPRTYAVATDLAGGITGAQASIYSTAKLLVEQAQSMLDGLYPLITDSDPENVSARRAIVSSQLSELLVELGAAGGPTVRRVDRIFEILITATGTASPAAVGGQLGLLRDELGLAVNRANTVDEEQNLTNFRILVDHVASLRQSWQANREFFTRHGDQAFFGTALVLLSRQLSVIGESVMEVEHAFDSVSIGPDERQILQIEFDSPAGTPVVMFLDELLAWVRTFATEEAPALIEDGGRLGLEEAVVPVAQELTNLVRIAASLEPDYVQAGGAIVKAGPSLPGGYFTERVKRTLRELAGQLDQFADLAGRVGATPLRTRQPRRRVAPPPPRTPAGGGAIGSGSPPASPPSGSGGGRSGSQSGTPPSSGGATGGTSGQSTQGGAPPASSGGSPSSQSAA